MFRNDNDLTKVFNVLEDQYKKYDCIVSPFKIENKTIKVSGDRYSDPVVTLLALQKHGIMTISVKNLPNETDELTIKGCDMQAFNKLTECWPNYKNVHVICDQLGYLVIDKKNQIQKTNLGFFSQPLWPLLPFSASAYSDGIAAPAKPSVSG